MLEKLRHFKNIGSGTMLSYSDIKKGVYIILDGIPHQILEASLQFHGRGSSVTETKLKNLKTDNIISRTFRPSDVFAEPELEEKKLKFVYSNKGKYVFFELENPGKRMEIKEENIGDAGRFLKQDEIVDALFFEDKILNIFLPIKIHLKVLEAPPGVRHGRAEAGTKQVILESGAAINVPIFIEEGDIIEVNTETGEYVRRVD